MAQTQVQIQPRSAIIKSGEFFGNVDDNKAKNVDQIFIEKD